MTATIRGADEIQEGLGEKDVRLATVKGGR